jgi:gliding motility-associated-like protein
MKKQASLLSVLLLSFCFSYSQTCTIPDSFFPDDTVVVCNGGNYQVNAPVIPGATYNWSSGEGGYSVTLNFNRKVWLEINDATCSRSDTITVLFNSFLLSPQINDVKLCKGGPVGVLPVSGQNLLWYRDPVGGTSNPGLPVPSTADTGRMTYWFSQTIRGCESPRMPMLVRVIDKPMFELGDAFIIPCGATGIVLQVVADGESDYTWSNGSHEVEMVATTRGKYSLYAQNMCGNHRDTAIAVECEDKCVQFPNAFSPNGDGTNDYYRAGVFCPVPKYKLVIYNRNGELVYRTTDPLAGWDGYFKGRLQPNGAYVYYTEFFDFILKQNFTQKGTLVLLH